MIWLKTQPFVLTPHKESIRYVIVLPSAPDKAAICDLLGVSPISRGSKYEAFLFDSVY